MAKLDFETKLTDAPVLLTPMVLFPLRCLQLGKGIWFIVGRISALGEAACHPSTPDQASILSME